MDLCKLPLYFYCVNTGCHYVFMMRSSAEVVLMVKRKISHYILISYIKLGVDQLVWRFVFPLQCQFSVTDVLMMCKNELELECRDCRIGFDRRCRACFANKGHTYLNQDCWKG